MCKSQKSKNGLQNIKKIFFVMTKMLNKYDHKTHFRKLD